MLHNTAPRIAVLAHYIIQNCTIWIGIFFRLEIYSLFFLQINLVEKIMLFKKGNELKY